MSIQNYSHKFDQQRSNNLSSKRSLPVLHCFGEDPRRSSATTCQIGRISGPTARDIRSLAASVTARCVSKHLLRLAQSAQNTLMPHEKGRQLNHA